MNMAPEEIDGVLESLRTLVYQSVDEGDEVNIDFAEIKRVTRAIHKWKKSGAEGEIPYLDDLKKWGILDAGGSQVESSVTAEPAGDYGDAAVDLPEVDVDEDPSDEAAEEEPEGDPDDALQDAFNSALTLLEDNQYLAAIEAFEELDAKAQGRLKPEVENRLFKAKEAREAAVAALTTEAEEYAKENAKDLRGIREHWEKVLALDENNPDARTAQERIRSSKTSDDTKREINDLRGRAGRALVDQDLPRMNEVLGEAKTLQQNNLDDALVVDINSLLREIDGKRELLREDLSDASTLVAADSVMAYARARDYFNRHVTVIVDAAGHIGEAGAEVPTVDFYKFARQLCLSSLRSIANQRIKEADGQKAESPRQALDTLQDAIERLTDEILTTEDREELAPSLDLVKKSIAEVKGRIEQFNAARKKVLAAQEPGLSPGEQYQLYQEAYEIYADYPNIGTYKESALDAVAAVEAGRIEKKIAQAKQQISADEFDKAMATLDEARDYALNIVPHPKPDSGLQQRLNEVRQVEDKVVAAETRYKHLQAMLDEISGLLDAHEQDKTAGKLSTARIRLEQMTGEYEVNHPDTQKVWTRLIELQGIGESWQQGLDAYREGDWSKAISLLRRVTESDAPEKAEATKLVARALAARSVLNAQEAEGAGRWREALNKYRSAENSFAEVGPDPHTEYLFVACQAALENLKSFEDNDTRVQQAINQAAGLLESAETQVNERRVILSERVEPIPNFAEAIEALEEVKDLPSTLTEELETTRRRVLESWRGAYLEAMRASQRAADMQILKKAVSLGETLDERGLLFEANDKNTLRAVEERYLDLQYQAVNRKANLQLDDFQLIEANRQQRLDIAAVQTDDLQREYHEAVAGRVVFQIGEHKRSSLDGALNFLKQELRVNPILYQKDTLFVELVHLCWQKRDWNAAREQAEGLAYRHMLDDPRTQSIMWIGLNEAAQLLDRSQISLFNAELETLAQQHDLQMAQRAVIEEQRGWLVQWRVDVLRRRATDKVQEKGEGRTIEAAQLYAEAYQLDRDNLFVRQGLKGLNRELVPSLEARFQEAKALRIRGALDSTLVKANLLLAALVAIENVGPALNLSEDIHVELRESVTLLEGKIKPWTQIQKQLSLVDAELDRALADPGTFHRDSEGGWDLSGVQSRFQEVQRAADRSERELVMLLNQKSNEINELDRRAQELNDGVRAFRRAIEDEDFEDVVARSAELEGLWRERVMDGFHGIELLVRYDYAYSKDNVRRIDEHRTIAQRQKGNFEEWRNWAERATKDYNLTSKDATKLKDGLDDLRLSEPLREIAVSCRNILEASSAFNDTIALQPEVPPLSRKAAVEKGKVNQSWVTEVADDKSGYATQANRMLHLIDAELRRLEDGPLKKLRSAVNQLDVAEARVGKPKGFLGLGGTVQGIPEQNFRVARQYLERCLKIDPFNTDVARYRARIEELEKQYLKE